MCYARASVRKKPMCATVCPSQALFYGTREQIEQLRPMSEPVHSFRFGAQTITPKVGIMVRKGGRREEIVDVVAALDEAAAPRGIRSQDPGMKPDTPSRRAPEPLPADPFP